MTDTLLPPRTEEMRLHVLHVAAVLFLKEGYSAATLRKIAARAEINIGSLMHLFPNKESILCDLVTYVLEGQFKAAISFTKGKTEDKILLWAAETTLQLYMAESSVHIRELYVAAYSLPKTAEIIYHTIAKKMEYYFKEQCPNLEAKDFYEIEIATGSIMRGYISVPCDMYFTIDKKVKRFIETAFRVYGVSDAQIQSVVAFVSEFDFEKIAQQTIDNMLAYLENKV